MKMEKRFDPLIIRFIDLIDQKYKENILHSVDIFNKLGKRSYNSLREAIEDDDVEFVSHALNDLSISFLYPFYSYNELDYNYSKEGRIFEKLDSQLGAYDESDNPEIFITEEDYEWIKNTPSRDECIERDKKHWGIIDNKLYCSCSFVPPI